MKTSKLAFLALFAASAFVGCSRDHSPIDPVENDPPALVKTVVFPNIETIKKSSRTPAGALDKVVTVDESGQSPNSIPATRQYLYDNAGQLVGYADEVRPKEGSPGFSEVIYEYNDGKIFRMYNTMRSVGFFGQLDPGLNMQEFIYDKSNRVTKVHGYYVDANGVATFRGGSTHTLLYDNEGRLIESSTTGTTSQKKVYKYSGNNLESLVETYSSEPGQVSSEYTYVYKYDNIKKRLNLPEIPKLFAPTQPFFDQLFGDNNLVSMKSVSKFSSPNVEGSEMNIVYAYKFDMGGRIIEKVEDFKDNTPPISKLYYYK